MTGPLSLIFFTRFVFVSIGKTLRRVFEEKGVKLVVDNVSYDFVKGATIDYVDELIRSAFVVITPSLFRLISYHHCSYSVTGTIELNVESISHFLNLLCTYQK